MKNNNRFCLIFLALLLVASVCSCGNGRTSTNNVKYRSYDPVVQLMEEYVEFSLTDCSYTNSDYSAVVSGKIFTESGEVAITSETIVFSQKFGDIWQATLHSEDETEVYTLYAVRQGKGSVLSERQMNISPFSLTASEYEEYGDILYCMLWKYEYLKVFD